MPNENSFDHAKNLSLMVKLGVIDPNADVKDSDTFLAWGRLLDNTVLAPKFIAAGKTVHQIVAGMTAQEKADLRERVLGIAKFPA